MTQETVSRLFDISVALAEQLENDPGNTDLELRYHRAAGRFRRAQRLMFEAACSPAGGEL